MTTSLREAARVASPVLPWREWEPTISTLHLWLQVVGKIRMALTPPLNHWWHVALYVTSRGLTTSAIPNGPSQFQIDLDFIDHRLTVTDADPGVFSMGLTRMSVARFYRELMDGLRERGIEVPISTRPVELADATPFEADDVHAEYEPRHAHAAWLGLVQADRVMRAYQSGFVGKASPVHLWWGGFDIATSRFSGRPAPRHRGGVPNCPDWVMEEAYSREISSVGWWPHTEAPGPAFYAYLYPEPDGYRTAPVRPVDAYYDARLGEFILPNDALRDASDPDAAVLEFFQSTYEAGASLAGWDRGTLEPAIPPGRPPKRPWSTLPEAG